jgi:uncharacterized membrane protein
MTDLEAMVLRNQARLGQRKLSFSQRMSDRVTEFCGSWTFILIFSGLTIVWVLLNTAFLVWGLFDPYPFIFFNLVLTIVSTFQGPLIMMSQNRQVERDREAIRLIDSKLDELLVLSVEPQ